MVGNGVEKRRQAQSERVEMTSIMYRAISDEELIDLSKDIGKYDEEDIRSVGSNGLGMLTLDHIFSIKWKLLDDKNSRFNAWLAILPNGNTYKECFDKRIEPQWYHPYEYFGNYNRAVLIREMAHHGYGVRGIMNALGVDDYKIMVTLKRNKPLNFEKN